MKILFVHQNFPGQYGHLASAMAKIHGNVVTALGEKDYKFDEIKYISYPKPHGASNATHHYIRDFESAVRRAQEVVRQCVKLKEQGFIPDIVCAHAGWGEGFYIKDIFPDAKCLYYFEFFYKAKGADVGFDPDYPSPFDDLFRVRTKNMINLLSMDAADWGITPTKWQHDQYPKWFQDKLSVIHDGIDTDTVKPNPEAKLLLKELNLVLKAGDEIITFVNRNLEPYRGFHVFMRALPEILKRRPDAKILILGGDKVSYGPVPATHSSYKQKYLDEVGGKLDMSRVYFLGRVPYSVFLTILQVSAVHIYFTYPFILSWSMLEAMAAGCLVIGSRTPPVEEVITHGRNGLLVDFFDKQGLSDAVDDVLSHPDRMLEIRKNARETIIDKYDLKRVCLQKHISLIESLVNGKSSR